MGLIGNPLISSSFPVDYFNGNGSNKTFTLSAAAVGSGSVEVNISGVAQSPAVYTVAGTSLVFTTAPASGTNNIVVRHLGIRGVVNTIGAGSIGATELDTNAVSTIKIQDGAVTTAKLLDGAVTAAKITDGALGIAKINTTDITAFIRSFLNNNDAATARNTLGAVGLAGTETITGSKTFTGLTRMAGAPDSTTIPVGYIGETYEDNVTAGGALPLVSATAKTITSRLIPAGHWEIAGIVNFTFGATTQVTSFFGGASLTDAAMDGYQYSHRCAAFAPGAGAIMGYPIPIRVVYFDTPTTVYLIGTAGFTTSTCSAWGYLRIRRVS